MSVWNSPSSNELKVWGGGRGSPSFYRQKLGRWAAGREFPDPGCGGPAVNNGQPGKAVAALSAAGSSPADLLALSRVLRGEAADQLRSSTEHSFLGSTGHPYTIPGTQGQLVRARYKGPGPQRGWCESCMSSIMRSAALQVWSRSHRGPTDPFRGSVTSKLLLHLYGHLMCLCRGHSFKST